METKNLLMLILCALLIGGCNVYMSPEYQQTVTEAAKAINGLNENCQAGDPNACKAGLDKAAKTVNMILEASYGRQKMATTQELLKKLEEANEKLEQSAQETIKQQNQIILQLLTLLTSLLQKNA